MAEKHVFESSMARLDEIVKNLEKGDAPLDESLALFEEGIGLIDSCEKLLDEAQQRVMKLRKSEDGSPEELPFGDE